MGDIRAKLDTLAVTEPLFLSEIDIYAGSLPIGDMLRNIAKASNVSISYKGDNDLRVNCNLNSARITDLLYMLCTQYGLDLDVVGNIVSLYPHTAPSPEAPRPKASFHTVGSRLSYNLDNIPLQEAVKLIADASGTNIVVPAPLQQKKVSGYAVHLPLDDAIASLAAGNGLAAFKGENNIWSMETAPPDADNIRPFRNLRRELPQDNFLIDSLGRITAQINQGGIYDIICSLCERMNLNYYFISPVEGQTSLYLKEVGLHTFLKVLLTGTQYSYYEEEGIYMFGALKDDVLASVKVVPLQNRTVSNLTAAIPADIKKGVQVEAFNELNSLILSGDQRKVARVEQFVKSLDLTVPMVTIEVIIADVSKSVKNEVGIGLGIGQEPTTTKGTLSPGIDLDLNASAINSLINSFNGFGVINLGKVTPNFYANLQLLEANGSIELQSTPKLSTLNGHEAELKSGERRHYKEVNESLMGSQNPIQTSSYTWKYIDANLELKIVPFVSGNGEITLAIEISQTEFTNQEDNETPPGTSTRSFKSEIRVQNEEMVLLGGIERNDRQKTSKGLPFIARVPILKWIFGQTVDNSEVRKLNVFIKPTVVY